MDKLYRETTYLQSVALDHEMVASTNDFTGPAIVSAFTLGFIQFNMTEVEIFVCHQYRHMWTKAKRVHLGIPQMIQRQADPSPAPEAQPHTRHPNGVPERPPKYLLEH